jgi:hypothetical protein
MRTWFKNPRCTAVAVVGVLLVALGSSSGAAGQTPQAQRALTLRGQALNGLHGNAWTHVSTAEFKTLVEAFGPDVTTTMTPQQVRAELARGEGLSRLARLYATLTTPDSQSASASSGNGFDWGDAAIGAAGGLGIALAGAGGVLALRGRRTLAHV